MDRRQPVASPSASLAQLSSQTQTASTAYQGTGRSSIRSNNPPLYQSHSDGSARSARHQRVPATTAPPPNGQDGETLVDFLRSSEESITSVRSLAGASGSFALAREDLLRRRGEVDRSQRSFDNNQTITAGGRKRTSTGTETSGRRRPGNTTHGSSSSNPIDLTSSPQRPLPQLPNSERGTRQDREDILLPSWQADSDVAKCPVCKTLFSFWYRRHHCRKCGRVVCANCSPHRITIPRQFIVHPPPNTSSPIAVLSGITGLSELQEDRSPSSRSQGFPSGNSTIESRRRASLAMTGGEVVRVCNPCVPDPNLSPPPQRQSHLYSPSTHTDPPRYSLDHQPSRRAAVDNLRSPQNTPIILSSGNNSRTAHSANSTPRYAPPHGFPFSTGAISFPTATSPSQRTTPALPPLRRPSIPEEDECPVCGRELPPKTPTDNDAARVRHVEECIAQYSTSVPAPTPAPPTTQSQSQPHAPSPMSPASAQQQRQRRAHGNRMLVYHATEKDCISNEYDADAGAPAGTTGASRAAGAVAGPVAAECVICFEEFEVGDEMGRLECLCRFHRACIRQWWDTKGVGSCPTHQLQL